jgi:two-component system sensor histidine kinase KdpD
MADDRPDRDDRPSPEALLAQAAQEGRGRLKIFLGPYPGVGKTYSMLQAAQERRREGVDVVVGVVETHGRVETEALLHGLEALPRKRISYRGRVFGEMDLDAILWRKPKLVIIDELAHTNVPGSRHPKRWQDVDEILAAGIDVYTTLNVQHIESFNDIVAKISRVHVRETLPNKVLELASEIELVDLPPDDLLARLREGKVYVTREQAGRAIQHFFSKGNLTAFRELALRVAMERVDADVLNYMRTHAIPGPWPTQDRLMVCVNEAPIAAKLVRTTRRMAERQRVPWIAVNVLTPRHLSLPEDAKERTAETMRLAESLGAETATLHVESHIADEILSFARAHNVTRLVLGRPRRRTIGGLIQEDVARTLLRKAGGIEVTVVSPDESEPGAAHIRANAPELAFEPRVYAEATLATLVATLVGFVVDRYLPLANISLGYLTAVVFIATRAGLLPSLYTAVLSFFCYNFFFTDPYYTFSVFQEQDLLTITFFLVVAVLTGNLAARLKRQVEAMRRNARRTETLFDFSRKIAAAASLDDVLWAAVHHVASTLECHSLVLLPDSHGRLDIAAGYPPEDQLTPNDRGAADWAWQHGRRAGWSTDTLPGSAWLFLPLATQRGKLGLLSVTFADASRNLTPEQMQLLEALGDQVAIAIERTNLVRDIEEVRLVTETERLRSALLSSVSHDLRTPLVSVIGSATNLVAPDHALSESDRVQLAETILEESERLNRYVQNLLDMTRLSYGALQPSREWADIRELVGRAIKRVEKLARGHRIEHDMPADLPPVHIDPVLIEQVLVNLLDNAIKYSPADARITIEAEHGKDQLIVRVCDEGPGIPPEAREAVFDMFYRVRAADKQPAGTGLGLSICRGIVEAHGGVIVAKPGRAGRGTIIEFTLPLTAMPSVPDEHHEPAPEAAPEQEREKMPAAAKAAHD